MESIPELKKIVEKGIKRNPLGAMYYIEPIQVYVTKVLLLLGMNRIAVSLLWLFIGMVVALLFLTGEIKWGFLAVFLHYFQTILDGCDGQVAKYNKRRLTEEKDVQLWSYGLYLDFFQHIIIDVFTMSFFAIGIFKITGNIYSLIFGTIVVYLRMYRRTEYPFLILVANKLQVKKHVIQRLKFEQLSMIESNFFVRVIDTLFIWIKNGKKFYILILLSLVLDSFFKPITTQFGVFNFRLLFLIFASVVGLLGIIKDLFVGLIYGKLITKMKDVYSS